MSVLPQEFEALEPFVEKWALADFNARLTARYNGEMAELQAFYDVMQPLAEPAMQVLEAHPFEALPEDLLPLFRLVMALAHVAVSGERQRAPRPKSVKWPSNLVVIEGPAPA